MTKKKPAKKKPARKKPAKKKPARKPPSRVRIRSARRAANMSQRELAGRCRLSYVTLCRIETGVVKQASMRTIKAIARVLKVSWEELA